MKNKLLLIAWLFGLTCFTAFGQSSGRTVTEIKSSWKMHKFGK